MSTWHHRVAPDKWWGLELRLVHSSTLMQMPTPPTRRREDDPIAGSLFSLPHPTWPHAAASLPRVSGPSAPRVGRECGSPGARDHFRNLMNPSSSNRYTYAHGPC